VLPVFFDNMKQPTKIFLLGLIAAGLVWGAGVLNTRRLTHTESVLHAQCESENAKSRVEAAKRADRSLVNLSDAELAVLAKQRGASAQELIGQREAQRAEQSNAGLPVPPSDAWHVDHNEMICDATELQDLATTGLQAAMVEAQRVTISSKQWPVTAALILLSVGAIPWLWYFLLRRIAELRSAIAGKPPM